MSWLEFPRHCRVGPVLDLDPLLRAPRDIAPIAALGHQALKAKAAGGAEQLGADLAWLEGRDEYAIRPTA